MASSFLINASRKITISTCGTDKDEIPWTWYGNVTDSSLNNISFTFEEAFEDSRKAVDENFEKITKALKKALELIVGKIPLFGKIQGFDSLRTAVIFAYSAFSTMFADTGITDTSAADVSGRISELFSKDYMYKPPIRKGMPKLEIPIGNGIEIKFDYGSCNKFSAYEEVYTPIMRIYKALAPKIKDVDNGTGMGTWDVVNVPYNQQILPLMIKAAFPSEGRYKTDGGNFLGFTRQAGSNLSQIASHMANASDRWVEKKNTFKNEDKSDERRLIDDDNGGTAKVNSQIWSRFKKESTHKVDSNTLTTTPALPSKSYLESTFIEEDRNARFESNGSGPAAAIANAFKNMVSTYKKTNNEAKIENGFGTGFTLTATTTERGLVTRVVDTIDEAATAQSLELDNYVVSGSIEQGLNFVKETVPETGQGDNKKSFTDTLLDLVNFEYNLKGSTLQSLASMVLPQTSSITIGYPDIQDTSLKELYTKTGSTKAAKIQIRDVLFEKVTFKFDFSRLDEGGYPMSGSIKLEKIWNVRHAANTVSAISLGDGVDDTVISAPMTVSSTT